MNKPNNNGFKALNMVFDIVAIPYNLLAGLVLGIIAPIAAIAAMVGGVRMLTGKMPFLSLIQDEAQGRRLSLTLVPPEEAGELYAQQKEQISGDFVKLQTEIKAIIEEARDEAKAEASEDADEAEAEA